MSFAIKQYILHLLTKKLIEVRRAADGQDE